MAVQHLKPAAGAFSERSRTTERARALAQRGAVAVLNVIEQAGDLGGYAPLNVPRVQAIHSGPMYHTSGDVLDSISVPGLERAARFHAYFVAGVARADRKDLQP